MLRNSLKAAFRNLWKHRAFGFLNPILIDENNVMNCVELCIVCVCVLFSEITVCKSTFCYLILFIHVCCQNKKLTKTHNLKTTCAWEEFFNLPLMLNTRCIKLYIAVKH